MSNKKNKTCSVNSGAPIWLIGWLFTLGFIKMTLWKSVLAILVWPYFLGSALLEKIN